MGARAVAGGGGALLVLTCVVMAWSTRAGRPGVVLLAGMLVFGLGMGGAFVAGSIASLADVAGEDAGIAAGLQTVSFSVGATLGVACSPRSPRSGPALSSLVARRRVRSRTGCWRDPGRHFWPVLSSRSS
ncbi:MAG TPA: hypothetical protein VEK80_11125, partial [Kribbellaceae bacterium]|nr:hypothetical protein [Kribbellaceae bacterium]